ncbi:MAG: hypothetical protein HY763_13440 [Planctomycetes bacterium]|nr:hypothetical protein [Planctomycetota bacterium]
MRGTASSNSSASVGSPRADARASRAAPLLASATLVVFVVVLSLTNPYLIVDEGTYHFPAIKQFYDGDWSLPPGLPMLPTYHAAAAWVAELFVPRLYVLRGFSAAMGVAAVWLMVAIVRRLRCAHPDHAVLHFAWQPVMFPFWGLVYTEAASMLSLLAAVYWHLGRRYYVSAAALALACLVRQSNVVWVVFLALWMVRQDRSSGLSAARFTGAQARRLLGHGVILAAAVGALMSGTGRLTVAVVEANRPRFNPAQMYLFALFILALGAPVWMLHGRPALRAVLAFARAKRREAAMGLVASVPAVLLLIAGFDNPHPWNWDTNFLRNWPLVALGGLPVVRVCTAVLLVLWIPVPAQFWRRQPPGSLLPLTLIFSLLFLLPHPLAEPRYYIVPFFFLNLFASYTRQEARLLTAWYGVLSVAVAAYVCIAGRADGGIW